MFVTQHIKPEKYKGRYQRNSPGTARTVQRPDHGSITLSGELVDSPIGFPSASKSSPRRDCVVVVLLMDSCTSSCSATKRVTDWMFVGDEAELRWREGDDKTRSGNSVYM